MLQYSLVISCIILMLIEQVLIQILLIQHFMTIKSCVNPRIVLETLRDKILIDDLEVHYNEVFLSSVRYAFAEQPNIDWAFKTSFIKAQHNVGELAQKVTFKNDNIENYQDYIHEVKPFKTKIREYVSNYEKTDPTNSVLTDFDLPPRYSFDKKRIIASSAKVANNLITSVPNSTSVYPDKHWVENIGYEISEIAIGNTGSNYTLHTHTHSNNRRWRWFRCNCKSISKCRKN